MTSRLPPHSLLSLELVQQAAPLDRSLLTAVRQHVGAAGLAQTTALERLIAAGQEHAGLMAALRQVSSLLEQAAASGSIQEVYQASVEHQELLKHMERLIASALLQISATPVEMVSASVLESIAAGTRRQLTALDGLLQRTTETEDVSLDLTIRLAAIRDEVQQQFMQIARLEGLGQLRAFELLGEELIGRTSQLPQVTVEERQHMLEALARMATLQAQALRKGAPESRNPPSS